MQTVHGRIRNVQNEMTAAGQFKLILPKFTNRGHCSRIREAIVSERTTIQSLNKPKIMLIGPSCGAWSATFARCFSKAVNAEDPSRAYR